MRFEMRFSRGLLSLAASSFRAHIYRPLFARHFRAHLSRVSHRRSAHMPRLPLCTSVLVHERHVLFVAGPARFGARMAATARVAPRANGARGLRGGDASCG